MRVNLIIVERQRRGVTMDLGFQTWKDWLEVLVVPMGLGAAGGLYQLLKRRAEEKSFQRVVLRELEEIGPYPPEPIPDGQWQQHQKKQFVHQKIFDDPSQSRDLILRLPEDLVYFVNQLWASKAIANSEQWLHFLGELCDPNMTPRVVSRKPSNGGKPLFKSTMHFSKAQLETPKTPNLPLQGTRQKRRAPELSRWKYHRKFVLDEITILTA